MSRCTKKNCPMVGVSADCDLKDCPYRTAADQSKDTIYREDAIRVASKECHEFRGIFGRIEEGIKELPSADRPSGTYTNSDYDVEWYAIETTCNLCGEMWMGSRNFCPNCGARMKGADNEM